MEELWGVDRATGHDVNPREDCLSLEDLSTQTLRKNFWMNSWNDSLKNFWIKCDLQFCGSHGKENNSRI